ncbi:helix-turn-helix domain-containing protein [Chloroflexota bacterium]
MDVKIPGISSFLRGLLDRHNILPSKLSLDLGVSNATVHRWLVGEDIPSTGSCKKIADYFGIPLGHIMSLAGHLPNDLDLEVSKWPEFREYVQKKYSTELDGDLITMLEDLIKILGKREGHKRSQEIP